MNSSLRTEKSGAAASGGLESFYCGLQGKASSKTATTDSDGETANDPLFGSASEEEGGRNETADYLNGLQECEMVKALQKMIDRQKAHEEVRACICWSQYQACDSTGMVQVRLL